MTARDELALELFIGDNGNQPRETSVQDWIWFKVSGKAQAQVEHYKVMAEHVLAAGYRKPKVIGYIVVDRDGDVIGRKFTVRETAQAFADEWTADCKTAGIDWDYRVAEIFEPHQ